MSNSFKEKLLVKSNEFDEMCYAILMMYFDMSLDITDDKKAHLDSVHDYLYKLVTLTRDYFDTLYFITVHVSTIKQLRRKNCIIYVFHEKEKLKKLVDKANMIKRTILDEYKI